MVDQTQRSPTELLQTLHRRMAEQAALYEFTDRLFRASSRTEVYDAALDAIIRALGCSRASILLFDEHGKMDFVAWRGLSEVYRAAVSGHSPWKPGDRNAQPVCVEDGEAADIPDALKEALRRERIRGIGFIPLTVDGAVIGKFMTYYATPHHFETEEIGLAVTIARQLGFCIERLCAEDARAAAERALSSERELLRTIIDRAPVMLTLFHPASGSLQLNHQFEQLTGWRSDENTAAGLMEACYPDPDYRAKVAGFIEACSSEWMDITLQTRHGRIVETSWANFRLSDGTRIGIGIEITDRKRVEAQQALLLGEMSHRLRNLFAVASSVVDLSARGAQTTDEMAEAVHDRLGALTRAHDLTRPGPGPAFPAERETTLHALLTAIFAPYSAADATPRFLWSGCDLRIGGEALTGLALLLHEFMTNAAKHGALSRPGGMVEIDCAVGGGELALTWRERGGPPLHGPQGIRGFGAYLTERVVAGQFCGRVTTDWQPEGLLIHLWLPLDRLMAAKTRRPD